MRFISARIDTIAQTPSSVTIGCTVRLRHLGLVAPMVLAFESDEIGLWCGELRRMLDGRPNGSPVGYEVILELGPDSRVVALWSSDRSQRLAVPVAKSSGPSREAVKAAFAYINTYRERHCVQPPLRFGGGGWISHGTAVEPWTDDDLIVEARRLGWDG